MEILVVLIMSSTIIACLIFNFKAHSKKPGNSLVIHNNKSLFLGCPYSTQADGSCKNNCPKINFAYEPCADCPISSMVYIAIAIRNELENNNAITLNMQDSIVLHTNMFPGKQSSD
jgi:hypothetical protein